MMRARALPVLLLILPALFGACSSTKVSPQLAEAHYRIAVSHLMRPGGYFDARNRQLAFAEVEQAIALDPENFNYHQTLGDLLLLEDDLERAERAFVKAANLAPDRPEPLVGLGNLYMRQNRPKDAAKSYQLALGYRSYSTPEIVHFNLGKAYFQDGDYPRALESLQKAAVLIPRFDGVHYQIGLTLTEMGLTVGAEKSFRKVLELLPESSQAHFQLGLLYMKERRFPEAKTAFLEVVRIEKSGDLRERAQRYLAVLQ
jgi:tetratricopeptide (TPR) repeat protein